MISVFQTVRARISSSYLETARNVRRFASINQDSYGNPLSVLRFNSKESVVDDPVCNDIQVKVTSALVTPDDIAFVRGESNHPSISDYAGMTCVGEVTKLGKNVTDTKVGDQVVVLKSGAWTDCLNVPSYNDVVVSKQISSDQAAIFPIYIAAWAILHSFGPLNRGDTVFQASPNTPVGFSISILAKAKGLVVLEPNCDAILTTAFVKEHRGKHVAVASGVGGKTGAIAVKSLGQKGKMIVFRGKYSSLMTVDSVDIPVSSAIFRDASVEGFDLLSWVQNNPLLVSKASIDIQELLLKSNNWLTPTSVPLKQYQRAIQKVTDENSVVILRW